MWHQVKQMLRGEKHESVWPHGRTNSLSMCVGHLLVVLGRCHSRATQNAYGESTHYAFDTETRAWSRWGVDVPYASPETGSVVGCDDAQGPARLMEGYSNTTIHNGGVTQEEMPFHAGRSAAVQVGRHVLVLEPHTGKMHVLDTISGVWEDRGRLPFLVEQCRILRMTELDPHSAVVWYYDGGRRCVGGAVLEYPLDIVE
ncbi:hypothetical protein KIPB_004224 [Kipferlia bialata]|uniref:Kelch-type beta propeller n=1 Tax=Kipferlia bialata TaxID=797122 RepID=A0A391NL39_9EUKA|nr:hypothetical protein KIPB_004224 [Kipferlia bialata]|eukprot:g4224.t1